MLKNTRFTTAVLLGLLSGSLWLWGAGCDFDHVDAEGPATAEIVAALAAADTEAKAEQAIARLQEKVRPEYALPELAGTGRAELAARLVAYNARSAGPATSAGAVYARVASGWPEAPPEEEVDLEEVPEDNLQLILEVFRILAEDALLDPEDAYSAFLLTIAAEGPAVPAKFGTFNAGRSLSPVQAYLFETWLQAEFNPTEQLSASKGFPCKIQHRCGKKDKNGNYKKENGQYKYLICHKGKKTLCLRQSAANAHIKQHNDTCGPCHNHGGGQPK